MIDEVVFFHPSSRTIIFTDLVFNFSNEFTPGQKIFALLDGAYERPQVSRLTEYVLIRKRKEARAWADLILPWNFDRVVLAHKDIVEDGDKEAVRKAFEKL